jgi:predicted metal-dependent HD superfamily phosphohydrolase
MGSDEQAIRRTWRTLGGDEATVDDILARHREPHRRYHSVVHVARVLQTVDELLAVHHVDDPDAVRAAALFHDAVYDPGAPDNEQRSAELAVRSLRSNGWTPERCAVVGGLILATATHEANDADAEVLLDADLAVLGAEPSVYQAYVRGVRAEYAHVDDDAWRTGRSAVLRSFLDRDRIFRTATMWTHRERRARANLTAELADLAR